MSPARFYPLLLLFAPLLFLSSQPVETSVEGQILDNHFTPVEGAIVRLQGDALCTFSDPQGRFRLQRKPHSPAPLTAAKPGFRIASVSPQKTPLDVRLQPLPAEDNDAYLWIEPAPDPKKPNNCGNCHPDLHRDWAGSAHARSATNPRLLALLTGTDGSRPPRKDWNLSAQKPAGAGVCVACHAPTFHDPTLDYDFTAIQSVAARGVHCDYCHKIAGAPTDKLGTRFGRDGYYLLRPKDGDHITFGPLDDAVRPGESFAFAPFYKKSQYCASCHEGIIFGVHVYGTYSEWLASPARTEGKQCQTCHMAPTGKLTNIAPGKGGITRDPRTLASHHFPGGTAAMLKRCLRLEYHVVRKAASRERQRPEEDIEVMVSLRAEDVGHRLPTGFIDRHLVLVVEAYSAQGSRVRASAGPTLPDFAWPELSGQAGYLYAKVLRTDAGRSPLPFWLPADTMTDTRLQPGQADRRVFHFPGNAARLRIRLLYRRLWPQTAAPFGWADNETTLVDFWREVP